VAIVDDADIAENDYTLNTGFYVPSVIDDDIPTVEEALAEFEQAMAQLTEGEDRLEAVLAKEGLL
jgi:type I restriction enzyme M protein